MVGRKSNRRKRTRRQTMGDGVSSAFRGLRRVAPWILLILAFSGLPFLFTWAWNHGLKSSYFNVSELTIEGNERVLDSEIHNAIGYHGPETNIFEIDHERARDRLERDVAWIIEASVEKSLPGGLEVVVKERQLGGIALVGELMLVDLDGVPFKPVEREQGMDMAVVTGVGDSVEQLTKVDYGRISEALKIIELYDKVGVSAHDRLAEVHVDPVMGFTLITEREGVKVLFGEGLMEERLTRLKEVFSELKRRKLAVSLIRLDGERALERVAVSPIDELKEEEL